MTLHLPLSPLTSSGQRNCASWASQPQKSVTLRPCPGRRTTKSTRTCGGIGQKKHTHTEATLSVRKGTPLSPGWKFGILLLPNRSPLEYAGEKQTHHSVSHVHNKFCFGICLEKHTNNKSFIFENTIHLPSESKSLYQVFCKSLQILMGNSIVQHPAVTESTLCAPIGA